MKIPIQAPPVQLVNAVQRVRHHLLRLHQSLAPAPAVMAELIVGAWLAQTDHRRCRPPHRRCARDETSRAPRAGDRVGANPDALGRLLRALISRGIFRRRSDGRYDLTPLARTLRWDAPDSMAAFARFLDRPQEREHWSHCIDAVRTGRVGHSQVTWHGGDSNGSRSQPELSEVFNQAMTNSFGAGRRRGNRRLRLQRLSHHRGCCRRPRPAAGRHPRGDPKPLQASSSTCRM